MIEKINKLRIKKNYTEDNKKEYQEFIKRHKNDQDYIKIEYLLFEYEKNPIKKIKNKLKKVIENVDELYRIYILFKIGESEINIENYKKYLSFYGELKSNLNFKNEFLFEWNDLEIKFFDDDFEKFKKLEYLEKYSFCGEERYNRNLVNKIIKIERLIRNVKKCRVCRERYLKIFYEIVRRTGDLCEFLNENIQNSNYVLKLNLESKMVLNFLENLKKYENCEILNKKMILDFKTPEIFKELNDKFEILRENRKFNIKKLKKVLIRKFKDLFKSESNPLPFLPVFYDISNDFIQYPEQTGTKKISDLFNKLNLFSKK